MPDTIDNDLLYDAAKFSAKFFYIQSKPDDEGISRLVLCVFNKMQADYYKNRTLRDVVVKARQMGFSTGILAINTHKAMTQPNTRCAIVSHKDEASAYLLSIVNRFVNNFPIKMELDKQSAEQIRILFKMEGGLVADSVMTVGTAGAKIFGRAETYNTVHMTEVAHWAPEKTEEILAGVVNAVPATGSIVAESTPRGRSGYFFNLYQAAKRGDVPYKPFFYPWWMDDTYFLPPGSPLIAGIDKRRDYDDEEKDLIRRYALTDSQIRWRRWKFRELDSVKTDLFRQEFPENDIDCWLSSEFSVFDLAYLKRYINMVTAGRKEGNLTVWKDYIGGRSYCIGVDVAGGQAMGDFSVACVLDKRTNEHVATRRGRIPPGAFAEEVARLSARYNDATVAVERASHGLTVLHILEQKGTVNMYRQSIVDALGRAQRQVGWVTSQKSRPMMIDTLGSQLRSGDFSTSSENLVQEISNFQYINGKPQAPQGSFDDELFAMMIAVMVRETQPISVRRYKPEFYAVGV